MEIYKNRQFTPLERTEDLIKRMTLEEKIGQMMQINGQMPDLNEWVTDRFAGSFLHVINERAIELQKLAESTRLGIPLIFGIDAIHGHALYQDGTVFPTQLALSSSWNTKLLEEVGKITAIEVALTGIHWTFSPVLCIGRDLRWGRINETFGEDPYLIGVLASAIIKGYQGNDFSERFSILACAKHFAAYGESVGARDSVESEVSERKLRTVFLPPFKKAAQNGCATFMAGYNSIDGIPASANKKLLYDILKKEWGFDGIVVTDWNNVGNLVNQQYVAENFEEACKLAVKAGNDMIMNTPEFYEHALKLTKEGIIREEMLDDSVKRILRLKFSLGIFDDKRYPDQRDLDLLMCCQKHQDKAYEAACESMVLLKNENGILPIEKKIKSIALVGPSADDIRAQLGDWSRLTGQLGPSLTYRKTPLCTVFDGLKEYQEKLGFELIYEKGCEVIKPTLEGIENAVVAAEKSDVVIAVVGDTIEITGECKDRTHLDLTGGQQTLLEALKKTGKPLVVVLINGKPLSIPWVKENADAILEAWNPGMVGGKAVSDILFGEVNPTGKLTISFPYHVGQQPTYYNQYAGWHGGRYTDTWYDNKPLFPFGFGLSYTNYKYSNLSVNSESVTVNDVIKVSVDVENTGDRDGVEIVQLYVNDMVSSVMTPVKELKGYQRVQLKPGEKKTVSIDLHVSDLALVNSDCKEVVEPGIFEIMVGSSSRDEDLLKTKIRVV